MIKKKFLDSYIFISKYEIYDGPITLEMRPPNTIRYIMNKYVIDDKGLYYVIDEVTFKDKKYKIENFVKKYKDCLGY